MNARPVRLTLALLLCTAPALHSHAESLASSASSAGSAASASVSDSIHGSSRSSGGKQNVADGDYRVIEVAALPARPGMWRLRLQTDAPTGAEAADEFFLDLPQAALGERGVAVGEVVSVRNRAYGVEFARDPARETFFLALKDEWRNGLAANAVTP